MTTATSPGSTPGPGSPRSEQTVGEVMRPGIVPCARTATAEELARIMGATHADCVVILSGSHGVDRFPFVWGWVTREDLLRPLAALEPNATAEEIARTPIVRARVDFTVREARTLCDSIGVSHLLVVDPEHDTPLGVVSDSDLPRPTGDTAEPRKDGPCTTTS